MTTRRRVEKRMRRQAKGVVVNRISRLFGQGYREVRWPQRSRTPITVGYDGYTLDLYWFFFIFFFTLTWVVCLGQEARWPDIWFWYILYVLVLPVIMIEMECSLQFHLLLFFWLYYIFVKRACPGMVVVWSQVDSESIVRAQPIRSQHVMGGGVAVGTTRKQCRGKCKNVGILDNQIVENWDIAKHAGDITKRISRCVIEVHTIGRAGQQQENDQNP